MRVISPCCLLTCALTLCLAGEVAPAPAQPSWARSSGQDAAGTWAEAAVGELAVRLRWIPPGTFAMGSPDSEADRETEEVLRTVTISRGFWLAEREVTQALWQAVMRDVPAQPSSHAQLPVVLVSWQDCQGFLAKLNAMVQGLGAVLPSEAQWEYACRAGNAGPTAVATERFWHRGNAGAGPHHVATAAANAWGLYDMHGNVAEWCADRHGPYAVPAPADPTGPATGDEHVIRGGSWFFFASMCRSASRERAEPSFRWHNTGLRICAPAAKP